LVSILLSNCGGSGRRNGNEHDGFVGSFENTLGFYTLTYYAIIFECLLNQAELPFSDDTLEYDKSELFIFDDYYEQKKQFYSLNFQFDSVYIEFCAKDQFAATGVIDSIRISSGKLLIDEEKAVLKGKINCQFEYSYMKGSGEITINSDSLIFDNHQFMPFLEREDYNVIKFNASASYKQHSSSNSFDNALMNIFCSITYVKEERSIEKTKEDIFSLCFVKDENFWEFDSADKNLVDLLVNLPN
jgi:hypothetical protein